MMKRFLLLAGVAVVAAAMYVAASPASQQARGPTAKQFNALKKQVASLSKSAKALKKEADAEAGVLTCLVAGNSGLLPVNQFGTTTSGFLFGAPSSTTPTARSALDVDKSATPGALLVAVDPACVTSSGLAHAGSNLRLWRLRVR
jgi:hypothetical protein